MNVVTMMVVVVVVVGGDGDGDGDECVHEFLLPGSVCAITASEKSFDTVWILKNSL